MVMATRNWPLATGIAAPGCIAMTKGCCRPDPLGAWAFSIVVIPQALPGEMRMATVIWIWPLETLDTAPKCIEMMKGCCRPKLPGLPTIVIMLQTLPGETWTAMVIWTWLSGLRDRKTRSTATRLPRPTPVNLGSNRMFGKTCLTPICVNWIQPGTKRS